MRLYENGVGYFEREGVLSEDGAGVGVPASHVDDALKSLVILSSGNAKVSAIEFPSVVSDGAARSLAGLPLSGDRPVDYAHVLASLKGFRVELSLPKGATLRGRLLDVEETPAGAKSSATASRSFQLLVVGEDGSLVRARAESVEKIQPLDAEFSSRLQTAADALGGRAAQLSRNLRVLAQSSAPVRIGYIAETPVWRSSYRLVLPKEGVRAALQGFALVHNDTDEPWRDVGIELVNGTPDSFLYPLAAPRYMRRELLTPSEELSTVPQLALKTADGLWGNHIEDDTGADGFGLGGVGEGGGGYGEGIGLGRGGTVGFGRGTAGGAVPSSVIEVGDLAALPKAAAKDEGRLFSYRLAEAVSLRAHGSALLPFLSSTVAARRITRVGRDGVARSVVRFQNDSPYILPAGPLAIFEHAGFAGETLIGRLVPGDRAFISYGVDLDVSVRSSWQEVSRTTERVLWNAVARQLEEHFVHVNDLTLTLANHGGTPRTVAWALLEVVRNAKVEGADEMDYDSAQSEPLALFGVSPKQAALRKLRITEGKATWHRADDLTREVAERLSNEARLSASVRSAFRAAIPHIVVLTAARDRREAVEQRRREIEADLERNREHLKAAEGSAAGASPIAGRIVDLEKALDASRTEFQLAERNVTELTKQVATAFKDLEPTKNAPRPRKAN